MAVPPFIMRGVSGAPIDPQPPDLPAALEEGSDLGAGVELVRVADLSSAGADLRRVAVVESVLERADLTDALLGGARIVDVRVTDGSWANVRAAGAVLRRVSFDGVRLTGIDLSGSDMEDCVFRDCRFDLPSLRFARLQRVRFERCALQEADFAEATLESVAFESCALTGAVWTEAVCTRSELRGCDISGAVNAEQLRGMRMPWTDVVGAAGELAAALGIEILD
jgi:uncharacterized protein YjbI with pentapeptide repeats